MTIKFTDMTPTFGFHCHLIREASDIFDGLTDQEIEKRLRNGKVLRKNQGVVVSGILNVTAKGPESVKKCKERLIQYIEECRLDMRRKPPQVYHRRRIDAGSCNFCDSQSRMVWMVEGGHLSIRFCDDCFQDTVAAVGELRKLGL